MCGRLVWDGGLASELRCDESQLAGSWRSGVSPPPHSIHHLHRCKFDAHLPDHRHTRRHSLRLQCHNRGLCWVRHSHCLDHHTLWEHLCSQEQSQERRSPLRENHKMMSQERQSGIHRMRWPALPWVNHTPMLQVLPLATHMTMSRDPLWASHRMRGLPWEEKSGVHKNQMHLLGEAETHRSSWRTGDLEWWDLRIQCSRGPGGM